MKESPLEKKDDKSLAPLNTAISLYSHFSDSNFILTDEKDIIHYVSNALQKEFEGYTEELYQNHFSQYFKNIPVKPEASNFNIDQLRKNVKVFEFIRTNKEYVIEKKDQEKFNLYIFLPDEKSIAKSSLQQKLNLALENAQMGLWEWDVKTNKNIWSKECERIYGLEEGSYKGTYEDFISMVYPEDIKSLEAVLKKAIDTISHFETEHRIVKPSGEIAWVHSRGMVFTDEQGALSRITGLVMDITQQKISARELFESEERFRIVAEKTGQLIYDYDVETGKIFWQGAIEKITGYDQSEFSKVNINEWEKMVHPEDRDKATNELSKALYDNDGGEYSVIYRFQHKKGHYYYVHDNGLFLKKDGKPYRMLGTMRDLTDKVLSEEKLKQNEERYRSLLTDLQIGVMVQQTDSTITLINKVAAGIFNADPSEAKGVKTIPNHNWIVLNENGKIFPPEKRPFLIALQTKKPVENIVIGLQRTSDDPVKWMLVSSHPQLDEQGNVKEVISTLNDITKQRISEDALKNISTGVAATTGENFFNKLVSFLSQTLEVEYAVAGSLTHSGEKISTLAASYNGKIIENFEYNLANTPCETALSNPITHIDKGVQITYKDHKIISELSIESFMGIPLINSEGKVLGLLTVMSKKPISQPDIASYVLQVFAARAAAELERLKAERDKSSLIQKLIDQNKELQEFSYLLSHSIRSPVATLLGLTSLFDFKDTTNPFNSQVIENVKLVSDKLDTVIKDLSNSLAMRSPGDVKEKVSLPDLMKQVRENLKPEIEVKNPEIITDFTKAPVIITLKKYVYNILLSLFENALRFSAEDRPLRLEISSQTFENHILIRIKDNGIGIDLTRYQDQLFHMYKRFHSISQGKGLGLYMVKTQVHALQGKIEINSKVNEGTEVVISLPA